MGHISLPSLDDIVQEKDPRKQTEMLLNTVGMLIKNLSELNGYLTSKNIRASSIEADRMNVNELSAINSNLGTVTAGEIYGTYIATANGTYPRAEMSNVESLFKASTSSDKYVQILSQSGSTDTPLILLRDSEFLRTVLLYISDGTGDFTILTNGTIQISASSSDIILSGGKVKVPNWASFVNDDTEQSLQTALNAKASSFSGETVSMMVKLADGSNATLNFNNGVLTSVS